MVHQGGLSIYNSNDYYWSNCYIYSNGSWEKVSPYIYTNNQWKMAGAAGTQMIQFYTSDNKEFMTSDGKNFLVREN